MGKVMLKREPIIDGVYAMLVTPFDKSEKIDLAALKREAVWCIEQGAAGLVVAPSIGEFACLTNKERYLCFEVAFAEAKKRNPDIRMIAMTAATHTKEMLEHTRTAKAIGYDAAQLIAPYYWIPDEEEIFDYFETAAKEGLPLVVYHNPRLSKSKMSRSFLAKLAGISGVVGIKEVETDRHVELEPLFEKTRETGIRIFTTFRAFFDGFMLGSAGGFINVFALSACVKLYEVLKQGDFERGSQIQTMINEVFPRGGEDNKKHIGTTKMAASVVTGIDMGSPRAPYMLPPKKFEKQLRETLPKLYEMLKD